MSSKPPPPPAPTPSGPGSIPLAPRASMIIRPPAAAPPPPPPPPPSTGPPGPVRMSFPTPPQVPQVDHDVEDEGGDELEDAFDEMLNIDTEKELYTDEEEQDTRNNSSSVSPPRAAVPPPPAAPLRTPPPPMAPVSPAAVPRPPMAPPAPANNPPPPRPAPPVASPPVLPVSPPPSLPGSPPPPSAQRPAASTEPTATALTTGTALPGHEGLFIGAQVYIPELANVWGPVTILSKENKDISSKVYHVKYTKGTQSDVDFATTPYHPVNPQLMADMTALHHIHEPGILYNLRHRFLTQNAPYTYMASALIAVNPLHACPEPAMSAYVGQTANKVAPHPYAVAEAAYQNLSFSKVNQSIVISGVSGAGKTETAKIILRYLAARSPQDTSTAGTGAPRASTRTAAAPGVLLHKVEGLDAKLVDSSPLLESFGNAKTLRNNNSSRFGKFLKLCFSNGIPPQTAGGPPPPAGARAGLTGMTLIGALVETYLLEKNRVITQGPGECNFHIFYQLLNSKYAQALYLKGQSFSILSEESVRLFAQIKEAATLPAIEAALTLLGLSTSAIDNIWRILAGIMHLTNIVFEDHESPQGTIAIVEHKSMTYLRYAAELWAVDQYALLNLLTKREMFTRGEAYLVQYTVKEANFARDATAKAVYEALFAYIVRAINRSLVVADASGNNPVIDLQSQYFVGVLDIFGFENFAQNGFEQLLINYANEALQNTFNEQLFEKELELFRSENIDFTVSECPNNRQCVQLIAGRNSGIFKTLDSVSRQPKPSDERFCEELHKAFCTEKAHFLLVHKKDMRSKFTIKHYAGEVTYAVSAASVLSSASATPSAAMITTGKGVAAKAAADTAAALAAQNSSWIVKNNDSIPDALATLFGQSKLPEFRSLAGINEEVSDPAGSAVSSMRASISGAGAPVRRKSVMLKPTIVEIFSKSMDNLNALLSSTTCQFVRCIKPNEAMVAGEFDNIYVMDQVRSLGILQACEVLKVSLPTRISYAQLKASLAAVIRRVQHLFKGDNEVVLIACLLRAFNISTEHYRLGKTMVFFRPGQLARLEAMLNVADATAGGQDSDVVARIEESHAVNQKGLTLVRRAESNLAESELLFTELEKKYERLSSRSKNLPEVRSLDIPDDVVQKISLIESFLASASRKHQALSVRLAGLSASVEDATQMRGVAPAAMADLQRQNAQCQKEVTALGNMLEESRQGYQAFNDQIQVMEEQCGGISGQFFETLERNDALYEKIQDERNTCEDLTIRAKEQAERCQLDRVEALVQQASEAGRRMGDLMQELQRGIASALAELERFESAGENLDFAGVSQLAVSIINKLDNCQRGIGNSDGTVSQFERAIKTAKVNAAKEPAVPPPRPLTQAPPMQPPPVPAPVPSAPDARKPVGVNFSVKDLAALRQKKALEEAERGSESSGGGAVPSRPNPPLAPPAPKPAAPSAAGKNGAGSAVSGGDQQQRRGDDGSLPPGWVEKFDKKSGRTYYVNEVTKARQWKRPTWETETPIVSAAAASEAVEDEDGFVSYVLPPGWKELVDKKTGRAYYVNSETKERQWRRPDNNTRKSARLTEAPVRANEDASLAAVGDLQKNRRASRRFKGKETPAYLTEEQGGSMSNKAAAKVTLARKQSQAILEAEAVEEEKRNTVSFLCRIGTQNKKGYLLKQSKFIGRWKRRYFVLTDDLLEYWDRLQDYSLGKEGKTFFLSGACQTSFTSTQNCFCVSNPADQDDSTSWYLLAENEEDMLDWMQAINAHIHVRYVAEWNLTTDFWDRGNVETSFWKMPAATAKDVLRRPVGIRSLPISDGPRTGEGIYPGEIVEVVQILEQPPARHIWAQRYLRLAGDRGWVLENHPKANYAIMVPVPGTLIEDDTLRYVYSADCLEDLEVYNSPNCDEEHLTELRLHPGAILRCVAVWTTSTHAVSAAVEDGEEGIENEELVFVKLADGKGWAPMYHPITGGQILSLVSAPSTAKGVSTSNPTDRTVGNYDEEDPDHEPQQSQTAVSTKGSGQGSGKSGKSSNGVSKKDTAAQDAGSPARPGLTKQKSLKKAPSTVGLEGADDSSQTTPDSAPAVGKLKKQVSARSAGLARADEGDGESKVSTARGNIAALKASSGASTSTGTGTGSERDEPNALQKARRRAAKS